MLDMNLYFPDRTKSGTPRFDNYKTQGFNSQILRVQVPGGKSMDFYETGIHSFQRLQLILIGMLVTGTP